MESCSIKYIVNGTKEQIDRIEVDFLSFCRALVVVPDYFWPSGRTFPIDVRITYKESNDFQFGENDSPEDKIRQVVAQYPDCDLFVLHHSLFFGEDNWPSKYLLDGYGDGKTVCSYVVARGDYIFRNLQISLNNLINYIGRDFNKHYEHKDIIESLFPNDKKEVYVGAFSINRQTDTCIDIVDLNPYDGFKLTAPLVERYGTLTIASVHEFSYGGSPSVCKVESLKTFSPGDVPSLRAAERKSSSSESSGFVLEDTLSFVSSEKKSSDERFLQKNMNVPKDSPSLGKNDKGIKR